MKYTDVVKMLKQATWLGRRVNDVFGHDTAIGRTFGESNDTAAQNFYNSQISPETVAQRKQLAAQYDAAQNKTRAAVNQRVDKAVAQEQARSQAAKNQQLAKQRAQNSYIDSIAAQKGVQLTDAQRAQIRSKAQAQQTMAKRKPLVPQDTKVTNAQPTQSKRTAFNTPTRQGYRTPDGVWHPIA